MRRRTFVATIASMTTTTLSGCVEDDEPQPQPQISFLEVESHRHDAIYEFDIRIESDGATVFEANETLVAGPGKGTVVYENPVSGPGDYEVAVEVDEYDATVQTNELISAQEDCLYLNFYLGGTLHFESLSWPCEED